MCGLRIVLLAVEGDFGSPLLPGVLSFRTSTNNLRLIQCYVTIFRDRPQNISNSTIRRASRLLIPRRAELMRICNPRTIGGTGRQSHLLSVRGSRRWPQRLCLHELHTSVFLQSVSKKLVVEHGTSSIACRAFQARNVPESGSSISCKWFN